MRITTITGTCTLLLAVCIALTAILPNLEDYAEETAQDTGTVAGVSLGGVVEATPTNTLYSEVQAQKRELDARAQTLESKEQALTANRNTRDTGLVIAIIVLGCLVLVNFYFDIRRDTKPTVSV